MADERKGSDRNPRRNKFNSREKVTNSFAVFKFPILLDVRLIILFREKLLTHMKNYRNIRVLFIESDLTDPKILEANIRMKLKSPDYKYVIGILF